METSGEMAASTVASSACGIGARVFLQGDVIRVQSVSWREFSVLSGVLYCALIHSLQRCISMAPHSGYSRSAMSSLRLMVN